MTILFALACNNGCANPDSSEPPNDDTGISSTWDEDDPSFYNTAWEVPDRSLLDDLALPPAPDGNGYLYNSGPDGDLVIRPADRTPISAAAECATVVLACHEVGVRSTAGCLANVPVCGDEPWTGDDPMCCASACPAAFAQHRDAGLEVPEALATSLVRVPSCAPGVDDVLGGE